MKPLDLQNLFIRINEVSKQQASRQEALVHAQQVAGQEIEQNTKLADERVAKTGETGEGPGKVKDENPREKRRRPGARGGAGAEEDEAEEKGEDIFRDPDLGNRIDISG